MPSSPRTGAPIALLASLLLASGCLSLNVASLWSPALEETTLAEADGWTRNEILVLDISGVIAGGDGFFGDCHPHQIKAMLDRAEDNRRLRAVVLRIDSPGGTVTASDTIHHEIAAFRERTGVPVVAAIGGLGASGGYYVACAADRIYAQPTSLVGSIGVIARFPKIKGLADKVGYEEVVIKSGRMKDLADPLRDMSDEERRLFQTMIDRYHERFLGVVARGRPALAVNDELRAICDGRLYSPDQAVGHGLIDGIGYLDEALDEAKRQAGIDDAKVIAYSYRATDDDTIYSPTSAARPPRLGADLAAAARELRGETGFLYLWLPGE